MLSTGIDIGSRTIELVVLKDNEIIEIKQRDSGFDPMARAMERGMTVNNQITHN